MPRPKKEKTFATTCPHTDRVAYSKGMCKSCYNKSKLTDEAIAKTNASEAAKLAKQRYEDENREQRNAKRKVYATRSRLAYS
ncbi:hypothetical protein PseudUWO311_03360 [Pseudanabaena sp. UWO311]|uniref:hypothetical protein n=1 Tax=Pseudanabaena sp. UWO311 TaxID=2487337 RepID=UPI001158E4E5|nr:hypothetical protein [Pseudanabaena sp. UWO311]TYQ29181.1 hypothetical protein PseudUWO311_03360 [Pseudanabaena sp. UWO311]